MISLVKTALLLLSSSAIVASSSFSRGLVGIPRSGSRFGVPRGGGLFGGGAKEDKEVA